MQSINHQSQWLMCFYISMITNKYKLYFKVAPRTERVNTKIKIKNEIKACSTFSSILSYSLHGQIISHFTRTTHAILNFMQQLTPSAFIVFTGGISHSMILRHVSVAFCFFCVLDESGGGVRDDVDFSDRLDGLEIIRGESWILSTPSDRVYLPFFKVADTPFHIWGK